jgi:hypothetical protein
MVAMNRAGQIALLAALLALLLVSAAGGRSGGGESRASRDPYWLGPSFAGMQVTHEEAFSGASISYGDCELPEGEGGCSLPAQIQTSTSCGRNPIAIDNLPDRVYRLRGGGLAVAYEPTAVDVGTGNRTVTVYTNELELMSAALREVRRRSQPTPEPLPPPVYPRTVLRELKRVTAASDRLHGVEAVARATELSPPEVRLRLRIADLLGPQALAGVPVPTMSTATVERLRQLAFAADELGLAETAAKHGLTKAELRAKIRRVRGLVGSC